jgi:SAM-dependent methyltransferase
MGHRGVFDAIEGFYIGHILLFFRSHRIFPHFYDYADPSAVAIEHKLDPAAFSALVEFVYLRAGLFRRDSRKHYRLHEGYRSFYRLEFQIDKFLGAYGPAVENLQATLTGGALGRGLVDRKIEAAAYDEIRSPPNPLVIEEIAKRNIRSLVDFGCGPGTLLQLLAEAAPAFAGWGLDADGAMLDVARAALAQAGLGNRVKLVKADALRFEEALPDDALREAEAVHCKGLFDEFFRTSDEKAIHFLSRLRASFPGKVLFNVDYYGKLMRVNRPAAKYQHTILHDVLQQLTGQGTPPSDLRHWVEIYEAAGCETLHVYEGESSGIDWFVHVVKL